MDTNGSASFYRKASTLCLAVTWVFYDYLAPFSLYYNTCDGFDPQDSSIQYPDVGVETVTSSQLLRGCFTSLLVVSVSIELSKGDPITGTVKRIMRFLLTAGLGMFWAGVLLWIVKLRVGRLRPCFLHGCQLQSGELDSGDEMLLQPGMCQNEDYYYYCQSFFSGHAMVAFYTYVCIAVYISRNKVFWGRMLYLFCLLAPSWIGYTRLADNQHHLSDVVCGAGVGAVFAIGSSFILGLDS